MVKHLFFISNDLFGCHPTDTQPSLLIKRGRESGTYRWKEKEQEMNCSNVWRVKLLFRALFCESSN